MTTKNATKQADLIYDSVMNGQFTQAREYARPLTKKNIVQCIDYLSYFRTDKRGAIDTFMKLYR